MGHLVLGYPTLAESLRTAEKYIGAGVEILELQIPFSHPTADGPVITAACQEATLNGVSIRDCIEAIRVLRERAPAQEIMVMSYLNRIYTFGLQAFVAEMEDLGIRHLIIPDLPVDSLLGLSIGGCEKTPRSAQHDNSAGLKLVPVLAGNTPEDRLEKLLSQGFDFFYLMSDFKITGSGFSLHPRLKEIAQKIKSQQSKTNKQPRIGIGFGISNPEQARLVAQEADVAIIGSALIQAQNAGNLEEYLESLRRAFYVN